jgi:hypothetical protein
MTFLQTSKLFDQTVLDSASWLGPIVTQAVHISKVNASVLIGLSVRPMMSFFAVCHALMLLETSAKVASHAASLLESGVIEALDYACLNDFAFTGQSMSMLRYFLATDDQVLGPLSDRMLLFFRWPDRVKMCYTRKFGKFRSSGNQIKKKKDAFVYSQF